MVLIVFVIMLLNIRTESSKRAGHALVASYIIGFFVLVETFYFLNKSTLTGNKGIMDAAYINNAGHTELIGKAMFTEFLLPFEITSLLLLVAIVGAVILTKKKIS